MKSILVLTPFYSPNVGGVETHLDDLTAFLQKKKFNQVIITYQPLTTTNVKPPFIEKKSKITIFRIPWFRNNLFYRLESKPILQFPYLATGIFVFSFFYLLFNSAKIKTIHAHGLASMVVGFLLAKTFRKRFVVSIHTIYKFNQRQGLAKIVKRFFSSADAILVLARGAKDDIVSIGVPSEKIYVYTNWLDLSKQFISRDKGECRKRIGLKKDGFIALFVGRLSPEKGIKLLLETIPKVSKEIIFVIIGGGPMKPQVEEAARKYKNILYVGPVSYDVLPYYFNSADILFWGSVDQDYLGRVTMGALGSGLPVLIPSKTEYFGKLRPVEFDFPQGKIGYMLDPNPTSVANKLKGLLKENLKQMGENSRQYALTHFSEKNAEVFLKAYKN